MMRSATRIDYADRIDRVVAWLETAPLDEGGPSLDRLAGIAALSPHHFHRIYRLMTGEPIGETIRRIRLARSLPGLSQPDLPVISAMAASGYATSQAFARAIRAVAGQSAREARSSPEKVAELAALLTRGGDERAPLSIEIVSTEPFRVVAIRNVGAYAELDQAFEHLFALVFATLPMEKLAGIHGVPHDDPRFVPADAMRFDCALDVGPDLPLPPSTMPIIFAGGRHVRLRHIGSFDTIFDTVDLAYAITIAAGLPMSAAPPRIHYVDAPDDAPEAELRSDVYLPVEIE